MRPAVRPHDTKGGLRPEIVSEVLTSRGEFGLLMYMLQEAGGILDRFAEAQETSSVEELMTEPSLRGPDHRVNVEALKTTSIWLARWIEKAVGE